MLILILKLNKPISKFVKQNQNLLTKRLSENYQNYFWYENIL